MRISFLNFVNVKHVVKFKKIVRPNQYFLGSVFFGANNIIEANIIHLLFMMLQLVYV